MAHVGLRSLLSDMRQKNTEFHNMIDGMRRDNTGFSQQFRTLSRTVSLSEAQKLRASRKKVNREPLVIPKVPRPLIRQEEPPPAPLVPSTPNARRFYASPKLTKRRREEQYLQKEHSKYPHTVPLPPSEDSFELYFAVRTIDIDKAKITDRYNDTPVL